MVYNERMTTLESLLRQFRSERGLFILGAGASAGSVNLGPAFLRAPGVAYVTSGGGYPVHIPSHSPLSEKIIRAASDADFLHGRELRPGSENFFFRELLSRMNDGYGRVSLKQEMARARFIGAALESYRVFRHFRPSVILNYNLDGLATHHCGDIHEVFDPHGTVEVGYGSPLGTELVALVREYDLALAPDQFVMSVPESPIDGRLEDQLRKSMRTMPNFIAIIGYSFAGAWPGYEDFISLHYFMNRFRRFAGNVYVMSPYPYELADIIAQGIESRDVYAIPARWNVFAHAMMTSLSPGGIPRSLNHFCESLLDKHGHDRMSFPLDFAT
jgi:hypothetical protein